MSDYSLKLSEAEIGRYRFMAERARASEADLWRQAGIVPGAHVADVGCGPGAVLLLLAEAVTARGRVIGVDADEEAVAAARSQIEAGHLDNAEVRVGRAEATDLPAGSFDVVMLRHVLAHNGGNEQRIVDHLATLVRPGGAVYLVDVDLTAIRLFPARENLDDLPVRYAEFHRLRGNEPSIGIQLGHLAASADLTVEAYRGWFEISDMPPGLRPPSWAAREAMLAEGVVTEGDIARWAGAFDELDRQDERPVMFVPLFALVGRRPD